MCSDGGDAAGRNRGRARIGGDQRDERPRARSLGSAARPLFIVSALLLTAGALGCSRIVSALAVAGAALLYLSMFELAHGGSMAMAAMQHGRGSARADTSTFYAGIALILVSLTLQIIRRRRGTCRPLLQLGHSG